MADRGAAHWTQPEFADSPWLDGVQLSALWNAIDERIAGGPATLARMGDGQAVVVRRLRTTTDPEVDADYEWVIQDGALSESDWRHIDRVQAKNAFVWWVPPRTETVTYIVPVDGTQTITLQRPDAAYAFSAFDRDQHPATARLDDVAQTVVHTGTPASGEVKIEDFSLVLPSDVTAQQVVTITYYPAFRVWLPKQPKSVSAWNAVNRSLVITEVGGSDS